MTEPTRTKPAASSANVAAAGVAVRSKPKRRRVRPAAASRVLVTGLSVAATLGLATAMATPSTATDQPLQPAPDNEQLEQLEPPAATAVTATDQTAVTTSHAS